MMAHDIEGRLGGVPDVLVHIGAGDGQFASLARRCKRAVLVEPDPERFDELRAQVGQSANVSLRQNVLSDRASNVKFASASLRRFSSARAITGARTLYRGIRLAGETDLEGLPLHDLVGPVESGQSLVLILDAPSEGLVGLEQAEAAGLLGDQTTILIKIAEFALHEGGADRASIEAWAAPRGYRLERAADEDDPDVWLGWLNSPQTAHEETMDEVPEDETGPNDQPLMEDAANELAQKLARVEARNSVLEDRLESQAKLIQKHRSKAYRSQKQLEKAEEKLKAALAAAEAAEQRVEVDLEPLKQEAAGLAREVERSKQALDSSAAEAKAVSKERDLLRERLTGASAKIDELNKQITSARSDLDKAAKSEQNARKRLEDAKKAITSEKQRVAKESKSRGQAVRDLEAAVREAQSYQAELKSLQDKHAKLDEHSEALKQRYDAERAGRTEAETRIKAVERELGQARAETEAIKTDMTLMLRTQNMVQSDLKDLQSRYDALAAEKQELEGLLSRLMDRLYDASDRVKALSWAEADTQSRSAPEAEQ